MFTCAWHIHQRMLEQELNAAAPSTAASVPSHDMPATRSARFASTLHSSSYLSPPLAALRASLSSPVSFDSGDDLSPLPSNFLPTHPPATQSSSSSTRVFGRPLSSPNVFHSNADTWPAYQCHFLGGAFSLAIAYALVHPLDTIKTNIQANLRGNNSTLVAVKEALVSPATRRAVMKGFTVSIVGAAPQGGIRFSTYEWVKCKVLKAQVATNRRSSTPSPSSLSPSAASSQLPSAAVSPASWSATFSSPPDLPFSHPFLTTAFSAMCGDLASSVVKVPREVVTQNLQTGQYSSGVHAFTSILRRDGPLGLYRGYVSTALRDIPFMIVMFSVYENVKLYSGGLLAKYWWCSALAGAASGGLAGLCTTPVDVVKTRIMTSGLAELKGQGRRLGMWEVGSGIVRSEGWRGLMRGAGARSVWWFCVCGVFFPSYEQSKAVLYDGFNHRLHEHELPHLMPSAHV